MGVREVLLSWTAFASTVAAVAAVLAATRSTPTTPAPRCEGASLPTPGAHPPEVVEQPLPTQQAPDTAHEGPPTVDPDAFPAYPNLGQSEGLPTDGHLHHGTPLPAADDRIVRNPSTAFATAEAVAHLGAALAQVRRKHPRMHQVLVGDLSREVGGPLHGHASHQSGRDVDLGFLFRDRPSDPRSFQDANRENLHFRATFTLLRALTESHGKPGGMRWGLLDYEVQRILVQWARRSGAASPEELDTLFQYPRGAYAEVGLYRHYPNHRDHVHVRFACPTDDPVCASPSGPPMRRRGDPPAEQAAEPAGTATETPTRKHH